MRRNILILTVDASVLPPFRADGLRP